MTDTNWQDRWRATPLDWSPAFRVIPTRFPAVNLFDRVASPDDFEARSTRGACFPAFATVAISIEIVLHTHSDLQRLVLIGTCPPHR